MIKLVQNELIKIFKRKSIYFILFLSILGIIFYNSLNPDQNEYIPILYSTNDIPVMEMEKTLENKTGEEYIAQKANIDVIKLYNSYQENSWQRRVLKEERAGRIIEGVDTIFNKDIEELLKSINDFELNPDTGISEKDYENLKIKYNEYVQALNSNNWKEFVNLKIKNLKEKKNTNGITEIEIDGINFEIEVYEIRLKYNINFDNNLQNQYINEYKDSYYSIRLYNNHNESQAFKNKTLNTYKAKMNMCKYAIENNLNRDISNEFNIIPENKIDARISFIRTFKNFDLIIIIIAIYLSTTIVTEEVNKKTIKNLLVKPHKRSTILISKIIACIITICVSMLIIIISQYIVGGIIFGFNSYNLDYIGYDFNNDMIININLFQYIMIVGISKLPMYIIIIVFCILIGTLNNHTSMSMILTLIIFLIGYKILPEWSKVESLSIVTRYFITNNWDFSIYLFGQVSDISGVSIFSSIIIYSIYIFILLYLAIYKFNKKEIYNNFS